MQKIYRILRNNKEQGPLSLEELLEYAPQPNDLIWVDGKSAGWRYPSEIEDLRKVATGMAVSGAELRQPAARVTTARSEPEAEEQELTPADLEKKANDIFARVHAYAKDQGEKQPQTKYARSLDDLKEEYAQWLHNKKKKGRPFVLPVGWKPGLGLAAAALVLVFFFNRQGGEIVMQKSGISQPGAGLPERVGQGSREEVPAKPYGVETVRESSSSASSVDDFIDSVRRVLDQQDREARSNPLKPIKYRPFKNVPETASSPAQPGAITKATEKLPLSKSVNMNARYMSGDTKKRVELLEVTISNHSMELLKLVTVDVFYYKRGDKLFDKETLYFNNIPPGNSFTLSAPGNNKAFEARFQLGQVSGSSN
ncbi:MAG TPA: hypothetical protein VFR58_01680 [Flavisolibacter sp.]|nr:hypothetical protein [Flavisolibacter sp.]